MFASVSAHDLYLHLFSVCFLTTCTPVCSFHPVISILNVGMVQVTEHSLGEPVYFSWLGCASVLKLCWVSVAAVWMCSLQHWQTTGLMRSRFFWFRVRYWHPSQLHRAVTVSLNPQDDVFIPAMLELTHNADRGLLPEGVCACVWAFVS